jgi:DNA polymerase-3 subunit alpha
MNQREAENLIKCGAMQTFERSEAMALAKVRLFFKNHCRRYLAELFTQQLSLPPYPKYQKILNELHLLKYSVTAHPLSLFLENNPGLDFTPSTELEQKKEKRVTAVGWVIMSRRLSTEKNQYMKFITIEDLWGTIEVVLFPHVYQQVGRQVKLSGPLQIIGEVQSRVPGEVNLIAEKVAPLKLFPNKQDVNHMSIPEYSMTG